MKIIDLPPLASSLTESIRDIGYSLNTAVADIIDNSISANSKNINVYSHEDEGIKFAIIDDGMGLVEEDLINAMRLGSQNPLEQRDLGDLGRFGLGLKTASFSQCRKLSVVSSINGIKTGVQWDLDHISKVNKWELSVLDENEILNLYQINRLESDGTIVIWEKCDRIIDTTARDSTAYYEKLESLEKHLQLIFHRFKTLKININDKKISYFDPFVENSGATQHLSEEVVRVNGEDVLIKPFVLPHHSKVSKEEYEYNAGEGGYLQNQGFYIYRNKRLIVHGTWMRIRPRSELAKLTRIRIDLPNNMDHEWKIDAKKSQAIPPQVIREKLKTIVDKCIGKSKRVYTHKGKVKASIKTPYWNRSSARGKIGYQVNESHPDIKDFIGSLDDNQKKEFQSILKDVGEFFPVASLYADYGSNPREFDNNVIDSEIEERILKDIEKYKDDFNENDFFEKYKRTEPYCFYKKSLVEFIHKNYE